MGSIVEGAGRDAVFGAGFLAREASLAHVSQGVGNQLLAGFRHCVLVCFAKKLDVLCPFLLWWSVSGVAIGAIGCGGQPVVCRGLLIL